MAKKKDEIVQENKESEDILFTKEQIINSNKFEDKKDVLNVILKENEKYSINEVLELIDEFLKEEVK